MAALASFWPLTLRKGKYDTFPYVAFKLVCIADVI